MALTPDSLAPPWETRPSPPPPREQTTSKARTHIARPRLRRIQTSPRRSRGHWVRAPDPWNPDPSRSCPFRPSHICPSGRNSRYFVLKRSAQDRTDRPHCTALHRPTAGELGNRRRRRSSCSDSPRTGLSPRWRGRPLPKSRHRRASRHPTGCHRRCATTCTELGLSTETPTIQPKYGKQSPLCPPYGTYTLPCRSCRAPLWFCCESKPGKEREHRRPAESRR
jgi:hypothetical protein